MTTPLLGQVLVAGQYNAASSAAHPVPVSALPAGALLLVGITGVGAGSATVTDTSGGTYPEIAASATTRLHGGLVAGDRPAGNLAVALPAAAAVNVAAVLITHPWDPPAVAVGEGPVSPAADGGVPVPVLSGPGTVVAFGSQGASSPGAWGAPLTRAGIVTSGNAAGYFQIGEATPAPGQAFDAGWAATSGGWRIIAVSVPYHFPPPPPPPPETISPPVSWGGLPLNGGNDGPRCSIVEALDGWYDTPVADGHDVVRTLMDGAAWGPKILAPRVLVIHGAAAVTDAAVDRGWLLNLRDQLALLATAREPAEVTVTEIDGDYTCEARADSESYQHAWIGGQIGFRWQCTLTAADPRKYAPWQEVTLTAQSAVPTGVTVDPFPPESWPWKFGASAMANQATLDNPGNAPTTIWALFTGRLQNAAISDGQRWIRLVELPEAQQVLVDTETLAATAYGGASRASYVLPNSQPILIPPRSSAVISLYGTQGGNVVLSWRPAWF
jgi:hypothetical protein